MPRDMAGAKNLDRTAATIALPQLDGELQGDSSKRPRRLWIVAGVLVLLGLVGAAAFDGRDTQSGSETANQTDDDVRVALASETTEELVTADETPAAPTDSETERTDSAGNPSGLPSPDPAGPDQSIVGPEGSDDGTLTRVTEIPATAAADTLRQVPLAEASTTATSSPSPQAEATSPPPTLEQSMPLPPEPTTDAATETTTAATSATGPPAPTNPPLTTSPSIPTGQPGSLTEYASADDGLHMAEVIATVTGRCSQLFTDGETATVGGFVYEALLIASHPRAIPSGTGYQLTVGSGGPYIVIGTSGSDQISGTDNSEVICRVAAMMTSAARAATTS